MNALELTGRAHTHLTALDGTGCRLHRAAVGAFLAMRAAAGREGIALEAASAFRDFDRQRQLWNAKFRGERALLDAAGRPLDAAAMGERERVEAILLWTALPGASRHHWGTDLDVVDRAALPHGYALQLTAEEYAPEGIFVRSHGFRTQIVPKHPLIEAIDQGKLAVQRAWFDAERCDSGLEALSHYRWDFNDRLNVFKSLPLHDWSSHAADAWRYLALSLKAGKQKPQALKYDLRGYV